MPVSPRQEHASSDSSSCFHLLRFQASASMDIRHASADDNAIFQSSFFYSSQQAMVSRTWLEIQLPLNQETHKTCLV